MKISFAFLLSVHFFFCYAQENQIDSLTQALNSAEGKSKVNIFNELSFQYSFIAPDKSINFANKALDLAKALNYKAGEVRGYYNLGNTYLEMGKNNDALLNFENGIAISSKLNDPVLTSKGLLNLGKYYGISGQFRKSIEHINASLILAKENKQEEILFQCYNSLGITYQNLGSYNKSLEYYFQSLAIREKLNNQRAISVCLTNIGHVFQLSEKYDDALRYFLKALAIDQKNKDESGVMINLLSIGVVYQKKKKFAKALVNFNEALEISRQLSYKKDEAILLGNIGSTLQHQGKLEEALAYQHLALSAKTSLDMHQSIAHSLNDLAETYLLLNKIDSAKSYAEKAISLSAKSGELNQLRYGYQNLSESYERLKDYETAYRFHIMSAKARDSLFSTIKSRQIEELQISYETKKKEQEIASLFQQKEAAEFRRNSYAGLAGLSLVVAFLLYYNQRLKIKKNRLLLEKGQEVEKMKSRFFTNITHEFRTPLTLILAPIATMAAQVDDPKLGRQLQIMKRNAKRLLTLVNQLLDLSKLEAGKLKINVAQGNIISIIKGVTMSFQSLAESNQIDLQVSSGPERLTLFFDQEKIEKVFINLLSNAFKFTPTGGQIQVVIQSPDIDEDKGGAGYLQITVKDTGIGIREDHVRHIFDRFYQAVDSVVKNYEGSGIGLALTREFVELHHGTIQVKSKEGKGTEMILRLPMGKEHFIEEGISVEDQLEDQIEAQLEENFPLKEDDALHLINGYDVHDEKDFPAQQKPIILLIEDNSDVRQYIKEILGEKNYEIIEAADGATGVEKAEEYTPDLILSDVMMPKMDGFQVCKMLKTAEKTSHIPVILLTAKASIEDKLEGLQIEADDYLTKPFNPEELLLRIDNLIKSRKKLRESYLKNMTLTPDKISIHSVDEIFLDRLMKIVEENMGDELFSVEKLGEKIGMSRSQLHRKLTALIGQGPNHLIRSFRLNRAHDLIRLNAATTAEIAYTVGFSSPSYFTKCFREQFGYTPSEV